MKIKSIEELNKIREEYHDRVLLRNQNNANNDEIEILVGMATCGISSGARETLNEFVEELSKEKVKNTKVISVGCIGYCHSEPTVQVNKGGEEPILYGNVTKDKVSRIIKEHIIGGQPVKDLIIAKGYE